MSNGTLTLFYVEGEGEFQSNYEGSSDPEKIYIEYSDGEKPRPPGLFIERPFCWWCVKPILVEDIVTMTLSCARCGKVKDE